MICSWLHHFDPGSTSKELGNLSRNLHLP